MVSKIYRNDLLAVATRAKLYCIHKKTGVRVWRNDYLTSGRISLFINDNDLLIAAADGRAYAYDLFTGFVQWVNRMDGVGSHEVAVSSTPTNTFNALSVPESQKPNEWSPADTPASENSVVILCSYGIVTGVDSKTGKTLWHYQCPDGMNDMPAVISEMGTVYIGCGRMVSALNPKNGEKIWAVVMSNSILGTRAMAMATVWGSRQAEIDTFSHSVGNTYPKPQSKLPWLK